MCRNIGSKDTYGLNRCGSDTAGLVETPFPMLPFGCQVERISERFTSLIWLRVLGKIEIFKQLEFDFVVTPFELEFSMETMLCTYDLAALADLELPIELVAVN